MAQCYHPGGNPGGKSGLTMLHIFSISATAEIAFSPSTGCLEESARRDSLPIVWQVEKAERRQDDRSHSRVAVEIAI